MRFWRRHRRFGIAVSDRQITIVPVGRTRMKSEAITLSISPPAVSGEYWPSLREALESARRSTAADVCHAHIVFAPPLSSAQRLTLPKLPGHVLRGVMARDAQRHFVNARGQHAVTLFRPRRSDVPVADVVSEAVLDQVLRAASDAGWHVEGTASAASAWLHAAEASKPRTKSALVELPDGVHFYGGRSGDIRAVRHGLSVAGLHSSLTDQERQWLPATLFSIDPAPLPEEVAAGVSVVNLEPLAAAAPFARKACDIPYLNASQDQLALRAARARSRLMIAAAAFLAVGALGLDFIDMQHELAAVSAQRRSLAPAVATASATRETLTELQRTTAAIRSLDGAPGNLSTVLVDIGRVIPQEAYVTKLFAHQDSLRIEILATDAALTYRELVRVEDVGSAAILNSVRNERGADGRVYERLVLGTTRRTSGGNEQ